MARCQQWGRDVRRRFTSHKKLKMPKEGTLIHLQPPWEVALILGLGGTDGHLASLLRGALQRRSLLCSVTSEADRV